MGMSKSWLLLICCVTFHKSLTFLSLICQGFLSGIIIIISYHHHDLQGC